MTKYLLVALDGGIYRDSLGEVIQAESREVLERRAALHKITDYRIVDYSLPWRVVEVADEDSP